MQAAARLNLRAELGNTISTDDYYEAQARMDGAFCSFTNSEKMDYLTKASNEFGVKNFEMEGTGYRIISNHLEYLI